MYFGYEEQKYLDIYGAIINYRLFLTAPRFIVYERDLNQKHMKEVFMFMKLMDIVSIVADKGTNLLVAD